MTVNHQMSSKAKGREYQPHMYPNLHHMRISSLSKKLPTLLRSIRHISENILLSDDGERSGLWLHSEDCSALSEPFHSLLPQILDHHHCHHYHLQYEKNHLKSTKVSLLVLCIWSLKITLLTNKNVAEWIKRLPGCRPGGWKCPSAQAMCSLWPIGLILSFIISPSSHYAHYDQQVWLFYYTTILSSSVSWV